MTVVNVGLLESVEQAGKVVVAIADGEVGVFSRDGKLFAWRNRCPHQGGPVCQGRMFHLVEEVVDDAKCSRGRTYNEGRMNIVCPWHGAEFDIETGKSAGGGRWSLHPVKVFVEKGQVFIDA